MLDFWVFLYGDHLDADAIETRLTTLKRGNQPKLQVGLKVNIFGWKLSLDGQKLAKPLLKTRIPMFLVKIRIIYGSYFPCSKPQYFILGLWSLQERRMYKMD